MMTDSGPRIQMLEVLKAMKPGLVQPKQDS